MNHSLPDAQLARPSRSGSAQASGERTIRRISVGRRGRSHRANRFHQCVDPAMFALHDAQLVLARSYGFDSWPKLKAYVDGVTIRRLVEVVQAGDVERVRAMLRIRPELVNREAPSSNGLMPLHYAVIQRLPEMVQTLMQFGADPNTTTVGIYALRHAAQPLTIAVERGYDQIARQSFLRREAAFSRNYGCGRRSFGANLQNHDEDRAIEILNGRSGVDGLPQLRTIDGPFCTLPQRFFAPTRSLAAQRRRLTRRYRRCTAPRLSMRLECMSIPIGVEETTAMAHLLLNRGGQRPHGRR